jgi:hypothetical protein
MKKKKDKNTVLQLSVIFVFSVFNCIKTSFFPEHIIGKSENSCTEICHFVFTSMEQNMTEKMHSCNTLSCMLMFYHYIHLNFVLNIVQFTKYLLGMYVH